MFNPLEQNSLIVASASAVNLLVYSFRLFVFVVVDLELSKLMRGQSNRLTFFERLYHSEPGYQALPLFNFHFPLSTHVSLIEKYLLLGSNFTDLRNYCV